MGAGSGQFALAAARVCQRVIALDISEPMIDRLRKQATAADLANIDVEQAGFLSYQHQGEPVGFVYTRNALHHLPDFWKVIAIKRIHAMLARGGVLRVRDLVFSCGPDAIEDVVAEWLDAAPEDEGLGWTREELETHLRDEHSTFSWLLEPMFEQAGFDIKQANYSESNVFAAYVCVKR